MNPTDLKYTTDHEWVKLEGDIATVGITDHAQEQLSDVVFAELPETGKKLSKGDEAVVLESAKAAASVYAPAAGEVTDANADLDGDPGTINREPYGAGWIYKIKLSDPSSLDGLMDAAAYDKFVTEQEG